MLAPLGGAFGYKGAGLAGLVEILSAVFTGMTSSLDMLPMVGGDLSTPRKMGAFVLAIRPDAIIDAASFRGRHAALSRHAARVPGEGRRRRPRPWRQGVGGGGKARSSGRADRSRTRSGHSTK